MVFKKKAAKGGGAGGDEPKKRRGGRKPGVWKLTNPDALREFRSTHKISRARLAGMLGVSSTSVQNWETGTVASMKIQQKLADIMKEGPAAFIPLKRGGGGGWVGAAGTMDPLITTTGTIVAGYLTSQDKAMNQDDLVALIRNVRIALS